MWTGGELKKMKITEHLRFTGKSYQIMIEPEDNLNPIEIGECFQKQYPKELAVIVFKENPKSFNEGFEKEDKDED